MAALEGKKDILAENDKRFTGGGSGGSGAGGGGGGGNWFSSGDFEKFKYEAGETLKAAAIIVGAVRS